MISVYKLKPKFQKLLKPLMFRLHSMGVSPNAITVAGIVLSFAMGIMLMYSSSYSYFLILIPLLYFLRMVLNALDGMLAKTYNLASKTGQILNEIGDVVSDLFIFIGFSFIEAVGLYYILVFISLSIINELCGILAQNVYGVRAYHGPMGKSDRALFISLMCIALYAYPPISEWLNYLVVGASILLVISSLRRLSKP